MSLESFIRVIPDWPKAGISFKDVTTLLKDAKAFRQAIHTMAEPYRESGVELVVGPEARGFLFGAPLAYELGAGFVPVRKPGKLPGETISVSYQLEYGQDSLEIHRDAIQPGQRVLVVDDLLATGGTVASTVKLVEELGGIVIGVAFLI
ncbi:MAG: adenine phosphoribosyltransferase, partial [Bacillota bacterium]